jgi:hypothetical protein
MPVLLWSGASALVGMASGWFASGETAEITENLSVTADKTSNIIKWLVVAGIVYILIKNMDVVRKVLK